MAASCRRKALARRKQATLRHRLMNSHHAYAYA